MKIDFAAGTWMNEPNRSEVSSQTVAITTDPGTDLWQRTYYGFRNDNAPALLLESEENFTFTTKVEFDYRTRFDQCGVVVYLDSENWFKASIEYENGSFSRLGSVVTNHGYSDWATTDISTVGTIWYRLSRRGPDMLIEQSPDGETFRQMRVFHLHRLGATTEAMGSLDPPAPPEVPLRFGLYACSPLEGSFTAVFSRFRLSECLWEAHGSL
ncbi:MAG: DUF1349 domain-containing protein [Spirochaetota bacterium]